MGGGAVRPERHYEGRHFSHRQPKKLQKVVSKDTTAGMRVNVSYMVGDMNGRSHNSYMTILFITGLCYEKYAIYELQDDLTWRVKVRSIHEVPKVVGCFGSLNKFR